MSCVEEDRAEIYVKDEDDIPDIQKLLMYHKSVDIIIDNSFSKKDIIKSLRNIIFSNYHRSIRVWRGYKE